MRYDNKGQPKTCTVHIPPRLAKFLYREAAKARKGKGGLQEEETDIVIKLIERWAETLEPVDWPSVLAELQAEAEAAEAEEKAEEKPAKKKGK